MHNKSIKELGEKELIKKISEYMPPNQTSDDCAYLEIDEAKLLINTDLMVENTHFNKNIISAKDLGWKAVITTYSDLVSSGCIKSLGINIGLVLAPETKYSWVEELYKGFSEALKEIGGSILGGDCSKGENTMISINAIGIQGNLILRRNACKPGQVLLSSGMHGLSKLGFLLQSNQISLNDLNLSKTIINKSINAFCRPQPKYKILNKIISSAKDQKIKIIGCTDSSDGFYQAIIDLALESNCKAIIDYQKLPKNKFWPKGNKWDEYYFFGGEDYELIFALPKSWAEELLKMDNQIKEIGYFAKGNSSVEIENCPINNLIKENYSYCHF